MTSTLFWTLIVLNVVLLGSFVWRVMPDNSAMAQRAAVARTGDYLILPAEVTGAANGVVVVLDQSSGMLTGLSYDEGARSFGQPMARLDLRTVFQGTPAPRGRGGAR